MWSYPLYKLRSSKWNWQIYLWKILFFFFVNYCFSDFTVKTKNHWLQIRFQIKWSETRDKEMNIFFYIIQFVYLYTDVEARGLVFIILYSSIHDITAIFHSFSLLLFSCLPNKQRVKERGTNMKWVKMNAVCYLFSLFS